MPRLFARALKLLVRQPSDGRKRCTEKKVMPCMIAQARHEFGVLNPCPDPRPFARRLVGEPARPHRPTPAQARDGRTAAGPPGRAAGMPSDAGRCGHIDAGSHPAGGRVRVGSVVGPSDPGAGCRAGSRKRSGRRSATERRTRDSRLRRMDRVNRMSRIRTVRTLLSAKTAGSSTRGPSWAFLAGHDQLHDQSLLAVGPHAELAMDDLQAAGFDPADRPRRRRPLTLSPALAFVIEGPAE